MLVNVALYSVISLQSSIVSVKQKYLLPLLVLFATLVYGYFKIYHLPLTPYPLPLKISVVQANIPQELKWNPQSNNYIMRQYFTVSQEVIKDHPDLIIWPEAALPVVLEEEPAYYEEVKDFVKKIKLPLLLGAVTKRHNLYYNSALLVSREGELLSRYDKLHLVPFGEYIPLRKIFGFLETVAPIGDFSAGREFTVFNLPAKFSVLICFEDLFPNLSREFVKKGAEFLINITNDAWFKETSSPYQHLQASVFRAVENRVFVVRSANTGVSGFIAPSGKIMSLVGDEFSRNIFIPGYKTKKVLVCRQNLSFYSRYGDFFVIVCFLFVLLFSVVILKKKR
jgi:apolipoprotein N-acyltransferase